MMATATNVNAANSPRHGGVMTTSKPMTSSSPWNQTSRGESEPIAAAVSANSVAIARSVMTEHATAGGVASPPRVEEEGLENGSGGGNAGKRPAWNKPSNGNEVGLGPLMGALWPALADSLSDAAKASSNKSSSLDSLKVLAANNSSLVSGSQGSGNAPSSPQRQASNISNTNSNPNHTAPSRQRSMKRNGNSSFNGGISHPPAPQGFAVDAPTNYPSPRDHAQRSGFVSQSHGDGDHQPQRPYRNRNGGHPRGDGSHHHSYGGRRDSDWNHRNFNSRDAQLQSPRVVPRFITPPPPPPPPASTPFVAPQLRPFGHLGFPEMPPMYYVPAQPPPPESLRGGPFIAPMHAVFIPAPADPQLLSRIVNQIDYYFSNENLVKDPYLRQNMDDQGWVPIRLIAGFKKVSLLTDNIQLILDALWSSAVVEVQGDKVRRRDEWMKWIMPHSVQLPNASTTQLRGNYYVDMMTARVQSVSLDPNSTDHNSTWSQVDGRAETSLSRSSSGDINNQPGIVFQGSSSYVASTRSSN